MSQVNEQDSNRKKNVTDETIKFMDGWFGNMTDVFAVVVVVAAVILLTNSGSLLEDPNKNFEDELSVAQPFEYEQETPVVAPPVQSNKVTKKVIEKNPTPKSKKQAPKKAPVEEEEEASVAVLDAELNLGEQEGHEEESEGSSWFSGMFNQEESVEESQEEPVQKVNKPQAKTGNTAKNSIWGSLFDVESDYSKDVEQEEEAPAVEPVAEDPVKYSSDDKTIWQGWNLFDKLPNAPEEEEESEEGQGLSEVFKSAFGWFTENLAAPDEDEPVEKKAAPSQKQKKKEQVIEYVGIDDTHTPWCAESCPKGECPSHLCAPKSQVDKASTVMCADNRYKTLSGKSFLCQASCNQPPFHCPSSHCACENEDMNTNKRCGSPRKCNLNEYVAVPGTIASNSWCNTTCNAGADRYCPCTLCECSVSCTQGLSNGDFSKGLAGWTTLRQKGSKGEIHVSVAGQPSPATGKEIPAFDNAEPFIAVMDQSAPGSYVLYQEYTPTRGDILSFSWLVQNWAKKFHVQQETMSTNVFRNQQFRVDIVDPSFKAWFDLEEGTSDILANVLSPEKVKGIMSALGQPPYSDVSPWQTIKYDLTKFAGRKILIAFRAVHNQGVLNVGLTNVKINNKICTQPAFGLKGAPKKNLVNPVIKDVGSIACGEMCQQVYAHQA